MGFVDLRCSCKVLISLTTIKVALLDFFRGIPPKCEP